MQTTKSNVRSEKIVLLGPSSAGKTSLVNRIISDKFSHSMKATIGAAFMSKTINVNGVDMRLDIWDTGGSEKYKALAPMYYRDARGVIIVYDLTNADSIREAQSWVDEVRSNNQNEIVIVCAANKSDLIENRKITKEDVDDFGFINQLDCFMETSALTGDNVVPLFNELCNLLSKLQPLPSKQKDVIQLTQQQITRSPQPEPTSPPPSSCSC